MKVKKSNLFKLRRRHRIFAAFTLISILHQIVFPSVAMALTGGPQAIDFAGFTSASSTGLVSEQSGAFNYSIPIINIEGYTMALSYNSSKTPEQESSWTGDWDLSPGQLSRSKVGYIDDANGLKVKKHNNTRSNWSVSLGANVSGEAFSFGENGGELSSVNGSVNKTIRYNVNKGFSIVRGASLSFLKGTTNLSFSRAAGKNSWSVSFDPASLLNPYKERQTKEIAEKVKKYEEDASNADCEKEAELKKEHDKDVDQTNKNYSTVRSAISFPISISAPSNYKTSQFSQYWGVSTNFRVGVEANFPGLPIEGGVVVGATGSYSQQWNKALTEETVYGYMYNQKATSDSRMDYFSDNDQPFDKRNKFIGTPMSGADVFNVSGDGVAGSFRAHQRYAGHYKPKNQISEIIEGNVGAEFNLGPTLVGAGGTGGLGVSLLTIKNWKGGNDNVSRDFLSNDADEPYFFRFANDLGGEISFGNEGIPQAFISGGGIQGAKVSNPTLSNYNLEMNEGKRVGRSAYIKHRTNGTIHSNPELKLAYGNEAEKFMDRSEDVLKDQIGEFEVTGKNGMRYIYSLPVYVKNEKSMSYDVDGVKYEDLENNHVFAKDIEGSNNVQIGEEFDTPYPTSYLLTEIVSPDYVNRSNNDVASNQAFGVGVAFKYKLTNGSYHKDGNSDDWYNYRAPYAGFYYNRGQLSSKRDDMGSVTAGQKETYYLDQMTSKNKRIVFITEDREDAISAASYETASSSLTSVGTKKMQKLTRIDEYAKSNGEEKLVKSTHFEYYPIDEGICQGLPNSAKGAKKKTGKLTLHKVWVEHMGVKNARIAPYIFEHEYRKQDDYASNVKSKYNDITNYASNLTSGDQNPEYSEYSTGPWGYYQPFGLERHMDMRTWVNQNPGVHYDSGAWLLKVIKLPIGGEIQVQYEQADYQYVQNKIGHVMVPLLSSINQDDKVVSGVKSHFYIDLESLGITDYKEKIKVINQFDKMYGGGKKKLYFKFLYRLAGDKEDPEISHCNAEFLDGFVSVDRVAYDSNTNTAKVYLDQGSGCDAGLPGQICRNFVKSQKAGNVDVVGNCEVKSDKKINNIKDLKFLTDFVDWLATPNVKAGYCQTLSEEHSYFRMPLTSRPIKGGGVRVKRLLMYDEGLETGDAVLYGTEYDYSTKDEDYGIISSGVASNLPAGSWEEHPLNQIIDRDAARLLFNSIKLNGGQCKAIYGRDMDQTIGPIAKSQLPGPSITYGKVTAKNIHDGPTNTGYVVKEFYTYKDKPIKLKMSEIQSNNPDWLYLPLIFLNLNVNNLFMSQGFKVVKPQFSGSPKSEATYDVDPNKGGTPSAQITYEYFDGEHDDVPLIGRGEKVTKGFPGREEEIVMESRSVADIHYNIDAEFDVNVGLALPFFPIPSGSVFPSASVGESKLKTHATTTIVSYPALLKKTTTMSRGIQSVTENVAFDKFTGDALLTRSYDGFHGKELAMSSNHIGVYENFDYRAAHYYDAMGPIYEADKKIIKSTTFGLNMTLKGIEAVLSQNARADWIEYTVPQGANECQYLRWLSIGDMLRINGYHYTVSEILPGRINLEVENNLITPVAVSPVSEITAKIVSSARKNQLTNSVGATSSYGVKTDFQNLQKTYLTTDDPANHCFCNSNTTYIPTNVVSANAITLSNSVNVNLRNHENANGLWETCFEGDEKWASIGRWRQEGTYVYKDDIIQANTSRIYKNAGVMQSFQPFDWMNPTASSSKWKKVSEITEYDPSGNALEEKNILGIYSAAQYGYDEQLVTMVAKNAQQKDIFFESFEKKYDLTYLEECDMMHLESVYENMKKLEKGEQVINDAHAGSASYKLPNEGQEIKELNNSNQLKSAGYLTKFWLKTNAETAIKVINEEAQEYYPSIKLSAYSTSFSSTKEVRVIARTGEWSLCEAFITPESFTKFGDQVFLYINHYEEKDAAGNNTGFMDYIIDDLIGYPGDAEVSAYVYDATTLRLLTSFDNQHFGLYNVYNPEGKLTMKKIETEEGIKTVKQTNYNTPGMLRPLSSK